MAGTPEFITLTDFRNGWDLNQDTDQQLCPGEKITRETKCSLFLSNKVFLTATLHLTLNPGECKLLINKVHMFFKKRSLRERTKKKNYKDDFDYNLSDEEKGEKPTADKVDEKNEIKSETTPVIPEPAIDGGANQLVAYRPNLEAEGEIAIIEKILAMRSVQKEEVTWF